MTAIDRVWIFDSSKCVVIGHAVGCQAVRWAEGRAVKGTLHLMGTAERAEDLDDMGHPVRMCKCTK